MADGGLAAAHLSMQESQGQEKRPQRRGRKGRQLAMFHQRQFLCVLAAVVFAVHELGSLKPPEKVSKYALISWTLIVSEDSGTSGTVLFAYNKECT